MRYEYVGFGRVKLMSGLQYTKGGVGTTAHQNHSGRHLKVGLLGFLLSWRTSVSKFHSPSIAGEEGEECSQLVPTAVFHD